jgi:threonine dehydrogenase-like Zn-dependent dehydrogenase
VLVEPLACAIHSVRRVDIPAGTSVVVIGAGTVGLLTLIALHEHSPSARVHVVAKHRHQQDRALALGATAVHAPDRAARALRRATTARMHVPERGSQFLLGGVDIAFECTGSAAGLDAALRLVRSGGTVVVSGMPSGSVDLAPLWYRELSLVGAYASDSGGPDGERPDFAEAVDLAGTAPLDDWVEPAYPLARWREALGHAVDAGRLGSVKIVFDPRRD